MPIDCFLAGPLWGAIFPLGLDEVRVRWVPFFSFHSGSLAPFLTPHPSSQCRVQTEYFISFLIYHSFKGNKWIFFFFYRKITTTCVYWYRMLLSYSIAFQQNTVALLCPKSNCKSSYFITILNEMKIFEVSLLWLNIWLRKMKLPLFELMKIKWTASEFNWVSVWIISMVGPIAVFGD